MSGKSDASTGVGLQDNVLKARKRVAASRADGALDVLAPGGGSPTDRMIRSVQAGAWQSAGSARATFLQNLAGAGDAVRRAFDTHAAQCSSDAALEPAQVDGGDPRESWKASAARIDRRVAALPPGSVAF